ncbi:PH domain-containing protein [Gordonia sp. HY285]|uniref:PH domain-containing protein n=1 Tax=Gordonia liuliyuniae TaxID=2911517 RepID=UPI001F3736B6|nr:PH domain-containing protein [Gordonia liuliyuniae]MCF8610681.1 PH domain-containing protein [Gordonia liuliyuniae]
MNPDSTPADQWDLVYTPRWIRRAAFWAAGVVIAIHLTFGLLLDISYTGVGVGWSDKIGLIAVGFVIAGVCLMPTRARLRVGPAGVGVRNLVGERLWEWDEVQGLEYPEKGWSAHLLLPYDEHIPVLAVQARDAERAIDAMTRFRELQGEYAPAR